mgnify:CR=1 FL=1
MSDDNQRMNQCPETPLPDRLRILPQDITIGLKTDHITFGAPYHHIPIGYLAHRAADAIEDLVKERDALRAELDECRRDVARYLAGLNLILKLVETKP